jgi:hypothetical protein
MNYLIVLFGLAIAHIIYTAFWDRPWEEGFDRFLSQCGALAAFWIVSSLRATPL